MGKNKLLTGRGNPSIVGGEPSSDSGSSSKVDLSTNNSFVEGLGDVVPTIYLYL
jgi:hypothetical protein